MKEGRIFKVYIHTNIEDNKKYVGITKMKNINRRWLNGRGYRHNIYFSRAINKYGWGNFRHEVILQNLTKKEAEIFEVEIIKYYKSADRRFGYNISNGGECIGKHSNESKEKMSEYRKGRALSKETREKISNTLKVNPPNKGKKFSQEHVAKIKYRMQNNHPCRKSVKNITTNKTFNSIKEAGEYYNICAVNIGQVCNNKRKKAGGFEWRYIDI